MSRQRITTPCIAVENGKPCPRPYYCSGHCEIHYWRMRRHGTIEKHAAGFKPQVPPIRLLGSPEWQSLRDAPTYAEEWTASIKELFQLYQMHYVQSVILSEFLF